LTRDVVVQSPAGFRNNLNAALNGTSKLPLIAELVEGN
jgi:hypothetical protein